jgi:hypothetical protein
MDLDDLFNPDHRRGKHGHYDHDDDHEHDRRGHRDDDHDRDYSAGNRQWMDRGDHRHGHDGDDLLNPSNIARGLLAHKKLLIVAGVALLGIVTSVVVVGWLLVGQAIDYVNKGGLKGVTESVRSNPDVGKVIDTVEKRGVKGVIDNVRQSPEVGKVVETVEKSGIKGVIERVWQGSGEAK